MKAFKANCLFILVSISGLLFANTADSEIVANLDFFVNYEYLEYVEENEQDGGRAVSAQDIEQLSTLGLEKKSLGSSQEQQ